MLKKILIPVDGSEHTTRAIEFAANIVKKMDVTIQLLHVARLTPAPDEIREYVETEKIKEPPAYFYLNLVGDRIISAAKAEAEIRGVEHIETSVVIGDPAEEIIDHAKREYVDMIVMGSQGLGAVTSKVCRETDQTCVIVKKALLDGKKILLVDDEPDVLDTLVDLLPMCETVSASTFEDAQKLLQTQDFELAILDIMGVKGYELLELAVQKKVIPIMLTAHALSLDNTIKSYKGGAASYVPKEKMADIVIYLNDILEAREKGKHFWWRWFERFGAFYEKRFGADMKKMVDKS